MAGRPTVAERKVLVETRRANLAAEIEAAREKQKKRERQLRAQLQHAEASVRLAERKRRDHLTFLAGGLVDRTGLLECDGPTLLGALMYVAKAIADKSAAVAEWKASGAAALELHLPAMKIAAE